VRDPADEICILRRRAPEVLARTLPGSWGEQRSACGDPRLLAAIASGAAEGMLALPAEGGLPGRIVVHRRVGQGGTSAVYVIDRAAMAAAFAPFRHTVYAVAGGMLLLVFVLAVTILAVLRRRARLAAFGLLNETVENLPVAVYRARLDAAGGWALRYASPALAMITGEPARRGGVPADWRALVDPVSRGGLARFTETLRAEGSATVEVRLLRPDGTWRLVRDRARILRRGKDGGSEVSGFLADVTELREAERRASETAKLATLGGLAAGLAHELNQPLTAVLLAAENAQHALETGDAPGALRRLERIIGEVERTQSITGHLQRIARAEGRDPLRAVDLAQAWRGALLMAGAALRQEAIQVTPALPDGLPPVTARPVQLEQVIVNLLLNARDALATRPPGQRHIRAEASLRDGAVVLRIRDSGTGIAPDILPRLFEPFVTTKPAAAGSGLGLSICRALMEEFGGGITARNGAAGAEFTLRLPVATQPAEGSQPA
jgi:C4-dicarboxylate-specific signal transduction histidine kinase